MKIKYLPKNIFLDTNIYEENNFLHGTRIHNIFDYSKKRIIKLHMTKISYWELKERILFNLNKAINDQRSFVDSINKTRILRNLNRYEMLVKPTFNVSSALDEIIKKLDNLIECGNVNFIDSNIVDIDKVFDQYYKSISPFSKNVDKKHEFPDAFIIESVDNWCELNSTKMIFVTKDKDFNNYKSSRIIFYNDLTQLLSDISEYYDSTTSNQILPEIDRRIKKYEEELISVIEEELDKRILTDLIYTNLNNLHFSKPSFINYKVTSIMPEYADVSYFVKVSFNAYIFPTELDIHKYVFSDNIKPERITSELILPCDFEFHYDREANIKLKWINSNEPLNLKNSRLAEQQL